MPKLTQNQHNLRRRNPNAICDVCGRKRHWHEVRLSYGTGDIAVIVACRDGCADYRHPLNDPPPVIFDSQPIPDARPDILAVNSTFITALPTPSGMTWFHLVNAGAWLQFNLPNNTFTLNQWNWFNFQRS